MTAGGPSQRPARLAILAAPADLALVGVGADQGWAEVRELTAPAGAPPDFTPNVTVAFGEVPPPPEPWPGTLVRWRREGDDGSPALVAGPDGEESVLRRAPWPVGDRVFELGGEVSGGGVLVVGGSAERRRQLCERLSSGGVGATGGERLTIEGLTAAAVVAVLTGSEEPLPAEVMAVPAARRLLVTGRYSLGFGLLPQVDHLLAVNDETVARYAFAALAHPRAFESVRAWGSIAAERHRAAAVYRRLLADIALQRAAGMPGFAGASAG